MRIAMTSLIADRRLQDKDTFLKLPRVQTNLKYNIGGLHSYNTKLTHLDMPGRTLVKFGK